MLRGNIVGINGDLSDYHVRIYIVGADGVFIKSTDQLNRDNDGDIVAVSDINQTSTGYTFCALVSASAFGNIKKNPNPIFKVMVFRGEDIVSISQFNCNHEDFIGEGNAPYIHAFAFYMLLVAKAARPLQRNDLTRMIRKVTEYFSLNEEGMAQFRKIVKDQVDLYHGIDDIDEVQRAIFKTNEAIDCQILTMLCAMIHDEILDRDEYHTQAHATILSRLAGFCPNAEVQKALRSLAAAIEQHIDSRETWQRAHNAERARFCEILGVPVTAGKDEIKRAYREAMKEVHPDVIRHLPPRQKRILEQHARELNEAIEFLMKGDK
jgi:hypothetical protein